MKYGKLLIAAFIGASTLLSASAMAEDHVVKAVVSQFQPLVVKIKPGDTVSWDNMVGHVTHAMDKYIPKGAEGWQSKLGENFQTPPLTVEGVYFYKCDPHWGLGMGGVIIVGNPTNLQAIKDAKPHGAAHRLLKKAEKALDAGKAMQ